MTLFAHDRKSSIPVWSQRLCVKALLHYAFRGLPHGGLFAGQSNRQNIKFMMMNYFRDSEEFNPHVFRYNSR
jgi:hypothetical protein